MKYLSIDSSLSNTGVARGEILGNDIFVHELLLSQTEKTDKKQVRASSDTIVRCKKTFQFVHGLISLHKPDVIFVETPQGSQSAAGMKSYGTTCMLIASFVPPPIEVTAMEVKLGSFGTKTASKEDMIKWAYEKYPGLGWFYNHKKELQAKNEHLADAIAIVYAGVKTDEFKRLQTLMRRP